MRPKRFLCRWYVWRKLCTYLALTPTMSANGPKRDSTRPMSHRSSIGCVQNDFRANGTFGKNRAPIWHQDQHYLQTDENELSLQPDHLRVPSGASKMISEPMVCSTQTVHLSSIDTNTVSKQKEARFHMTQVT